MLLLLEIVVVAWCLGRPVRLLAQPGFRRKLEAFPHVRTLILVGAASAAAVLAAAAIWWRPGFHLAAALAVGALTWDAIRARPGFGRRRGLPPGALRFAPLDPWRDQEFFRQQALAHGPVFKFCHVHRPTICLLGLSLGHELLRLHADKLKTLPLPFSRHVPNGFLRYMGAEERQRYRGVLASSLSREVAQANVPAIAEHIGEALPSVVAERADAGGRSDLGARLHAMTGNVLQRILFGPLEADERAGLWRALDSTDFRRAARRSGGRIRRGLEDAEVILRTRVAQMGSEPATRPTSALEALAASQPQMAADRTVLLNLFYMWQTASADVAGMLHWCIACLGASPHWRERLQEACQGDGVPPLARAIVQETLRMEQSEYLMREVQREFRHAGFRFPAGYLVRVCVRESHRLDPAVADADTFNPGRFLDGGLPRRHFSPFGTGATACPGEHLALLIGSIFLTELSRRYRWEATASGAPEFGGFHWRPGPGCRLRATVCGSLDAVPGRGRRSA